MCCLLFVFFVFFLFAGCFRCLLIVVSLFVTVRGWLFVIRCSSFVLFVHSSLFRVCCLFVVRCLLSVGG